MENLVLKGFNVMVNYHHTYDLEDIIFQGQTYMVRPFNNYFSKVKQAKRIVLEYLNSNFDYRKYDDLDSINFEKIDIISSILSQNVYKIFFKVNNEKYSLYIDLKKSIITSNYNDKDILLIKLLQPTVKRIKEIKVDKNYLRLVPIEIMLSDFGKSIQQHGYTNRRFYTNNMKFGIEFEIDSTRALSDQIFMKVLKYLQIENDLIFERDSSVQFTEVKTNPLSYEESVNLLTKLDLLRKMFPIHFQSDKAGLHIHISVLHPEAHSRAKYIKNILSRLIETSKIFYNLFGRSPSNYCEIDTSSTNRYSYINLSNSQTIEIRGGTTRTSCDMIKVLDFSKEFGEMMNGETAPTEEDVKNLFNRFFVSSKSVAA